MIENVEHHASEEESEMFPGAQRLLRRRPRGAGRAAGTQREPGGPDRGRQGAPHGRGLQELARAQEIPGRSSMDRDQLLATVAPS